jgi:hypothetical protein
LDEKLTSVKPLNAGLADISGYETQVNETRGQGNLSNVTIITQNAHAHQLFFLERSLIYPGETDE